MGQVMSRHHYGISSAVAHAQMSCCVEATLPVSQWIGSSFVTLILNHLTVQTMIVISTVRKDKETAANLIQPNMLLCRNSFA